MTDPTSRQYVALPGSERKLVPGAHVVGPIDPSEVIQLTIKLRSRGSAEDLTAQVNALGALPPSERTYLTPEEFESTYGADPADIDKIVEFARQQQLQVVQVSPDQRTVTLSGTAQQISQAFRVKLMKYDSPQGPYRGRLGPVHVPADLQPLIEGIFGLDNRLQARPQIVRARREATRAMAAEPVTTDSAGAATVENGVSFFPPEVGRIYNFPDHLTGEGQCIGLIEFGGGFRASDIAAYFQHVNLPVPQVEAVSVDGTPNQPGANPDIDGEVMLDIEVAASLAPAAKIVVYFAQFTEQGWIRAVTTAVHDRRNKPSVLSISWGFTEGQDIWTSQAVRAVNQTFQSAALLGVTICCASGDDGSEDQLADGHAHVDFPASSPYVLACGGTSLRLSGKAVTGETVWNDGPRATGGGAGGGGISDMNAVPPWQRGHVPPSVNPGHRIGRGVPDVAGNADGNSGYTILVDGQVATNVGGTSAVAPLWAGLIARMNQQLRKPVGFLNPLLYAKLSQAGIFHDITVGSNDPTNGVIGGYSAQAGWDPCTGWGSPNGALLLEALSKPSD
ncbi:MAG: protease pro-enzyme activation domain-containing protein [Ktedonobacterales bacterium]